MRVSTPEAPAISVRYALALIVLAATLSLALYVPTFRNSWAYDDISYINTSANVLAGRLSLTSALLLAHNEHVVPAFRLLFLVYLKLFGLNVVVWRVMTALVHAASAVFVALLAWRYSGKARAGAAAAITYVALAVFRRCSSGSPRERRCRWHSLRSPAPPRSWPGAIICGQGGSSPGLPSLVRC